MDYLLSVVVPLFNEEEVLMETHRRLRATLDELGESYEIIYVNDGSKDLTASLMRSLCTNDGTVKGITFARNFGHQVAITAGMDHASGQAIVIIDADLQDPPELIGEMVSKWRDGFEVVYGKRAQRQGETAFKKITAKTYYRFLNRLADVKIPTDVGDFRLIDRKVRDALLTLPEHSRYVRGLISWLGFRQTEISYVRASRFAGETKYPLRKMVALAVDGMTSFSYKPLRFSLWCGIGLSLFSFCFLIVVFVARLFNLIIMEPGYASLMCVMLFFFGMIMMLLGVIGLYIGRIFEEAKGRPLYIIATKDGKFGDRSLDRSEINNIWR